MSRILKPNRLKPLAAAILALLFAMPAYGMEVVDAWQKQIDDGVWYYRYKARHAGQPIQIHVARISLSADRYEIRPILAWDRLNRLETVGSMAGRHNAVIAINGSYFNRKTSNPFPVGFLMIGGRTLYFSHDYRSAFGITMDRYPLFGYPKTRGLVYLQDRQKWFYISGMNRKRGENEAVIYTSEYGERTGTNGHGREIVVSDDRVQEIRQGDSMIPGNGMVISVHGRAVDSFLPYFEIGRSVKARFEIDKEWLFVNQSLTGGPMLLESGRIVVDGTRRESFKRSMAERIPVTAIGHDGYDNIYFMVADGRNKKYSVGMTYLEAAQFMRDYLRAWNAIALDGGGSSTMVINGEVVNRPSDGHQRPVSNGVALVRK